MKLKKAALALGMLTLSLASCATAETGALLGPDQNIGGQGADEVSTPETEIPSTSESDSHDEATKCDFNVYLYSTSEYHLRNWVWIWDDSENANVGGGIQTAADRMALTDPETSKIYICEALMLNFNTPYTVYSDFNLTEESETPLIMTDKTSYDWLFFRAFVSYDETTTFVRRSGEYHLDSEKMVADADGDISIYINESIANNYSKQINNPGIFYDSESFFASLK